VESAAEQVRLIHRRDLELSGVNALVRDLKERNICTKKRPLATGGIRGGIPFERGALFYLLRNRFYIGEVRYKGEPGATWTANNNTSPAKKSDARFFSAIRHLSNQQKPFASECCAPRQGSRTAQRPRPVPPSRRGWRSWILAT
jgi:Recombinase